ncbi:hypothetical protein FW778_01300 [Ginsengibacter hankyongi]|uniref:Uncharacterized protein n=1 Tax=Ginsengibacter hankyongi TaxID=2607284 RepID=A0A5J5IHY0_9BACT|nr:hypothetical protein [Ginsengibacter hankyongi]KAA9040705.1 hypothetical protein FW778_01300 [Ginsengibacter hankyongi]
MRGSKTMTIDNPGLHKRRSRRHSGHSRKKRSLFYNIFKWAKKNPTKIIAILFGIVLIYITILFIQYANKNKRRNATTLKLEVKQYSNRYNELVAFE